jgi:hypothetical protein
MQQIFLFQPTLFDTNLNPIDTRTSRHLGRPKGFAPVIQLAEIFACPK